MLGSVLRLVLKPIDKFGAGHPRFNFAEMVGWKCTGQNDFCVEALGAKIMEVLLGVGRERIVEDVQDVEGLEVGCWVGVGAGVRAMMVIVVGHLWGG